MRSGPFEGPANNKPPALPGAMAPLKAERPDPLLEANVRAVADQLLARKGFTRVQEKPDVLISMNYEAEAGYSPYDYKIQALTLNIYKPEQRKLVWRGTASGSVLDISTDAASSDLKRAVEGILTNFPPK